MAFRGPAGCRKHFAVTGSDSITKPHWNQTAIDLHDTEGERRTDEFANHRYRVEPATAEPWLLAEDVCQTQLR